MTFHKNNTAESGSSLCAAHAAAWPAPLWHRWVWDGGSFSSKEPYPSRILFQHRFWYKINAKLMRWGAAEAGPATLPRPQIMAMLSGAQLRRVEVLLLPEDLQARPGAGCRAATSVSEDTAPNS